MSRSLSISCERAQQSASDPLEQRTWAAIRVYAARLCATRWLERESQEELDTIYVPAFPLAWWIVKNWWSLLNEPCPDEVPPSSFGAWTPRQRAWLQRHCLRSADAGLFLPRLSLWSDGRHLCAHWAPDPDDAFSSMPGRFLYGSTVLLAAGEVEDALRAFVTTVLRWIEDVSDPQAERLRANWQAITNADTEEAAFCRAAGHVGLDPYMASSWPTGLPELFETSLSGEDPQPIVGDLLSAAEPENAAALWNWVVDLRRAVDLQPAGKEPPSALNWNGQAGQAGFSAAYRLRQDLGLDGRSLPIQVGEVASAMGLAELVFQAQDHHPDTSIRAAVGWRDGMKAVVAGPIPPLSASRRFVEARGLFHAAFLCQHGPRLITRAHDWDQQASRGFAAELLAPRMALTMAVPPELDEDERASRIAELGRKYDVSAELIRRQLQNATRYGHAVTANPSPL